MIRVPIPAPEEIFKTGASGLLLTTRATLIKGCRWKYSMIFPALLPVPEANKAIWIISFSIQMKIGFDFAR
jgi:hypothetical protein